jgi:hypothetical protein
LGQSPASQARHDAEEAGRREGAPELDGRAEVGTHDVGAPIVILRCEMCGDDRSYNDVMGEVLLAASNRGAFGCPSCGAVGHLWVLQFVGADAERPGPPGQSNGPATG